MATHFYICQNCRSIFSAMTLNKMVERELPCPCGNYLTFGSAGMVSPDADPDLVEKSETMLPKVQEAFDRRTGK